MRLLLDTHIIIRLVEPGRPIPTRVLQALEDVRAELHVSAASFWEMSIKFAKRKIALAMPPAAMAEAMSRLGAQHLAVTHAHGCAELAIVPETADPFDRILLAQCQIEDMRLVTTDTALKAHPLALKV